jgi:hypothetical protein
MAEARRAQPGWLRFDTREALLLAFLATFLVVFRAALRLHLHVPGHAMFFTAALLLLARACVPRTGAATAVGLLAGAVCAVLGMGEGGPLIALKLALPGAAVDALRWVAPARSEGAILYAAVGVAAGVAGVATTPLVELLTGMAPGLVLQHTLLSASAKAAFGALGGLAAWAVVRRLRVHGLIPERGGAAREPAGGAPSPWPR